MPSLGELFIELGVVGDTKELERLDKQIREVAKKADDFVKTIKEEIEYNDKLEEITQKVTKATQELAAAETEEAKVAAQGALAAAEAQKKRLEQLKAAQEAAKAAHDEVDANQKAIDGKKELAKNIAGVVKGVGVFVGAIAGAAAALNKFTNDLVQTNQAMLDLTRNTDIAQGTFQKWGNIGKMLGVDNVEQQLEGLNQRMFDLMLTGEGARGFQLAGINPVGQDAEGVLEQLRARVSGMNDTTATYLLQQMGLDPRMLHLLRLTRQEFDGLSEAIRKYQLSPDDTKRIQAFNIQIQIAGIKLRYLKDKAIMALMPAWTQFLHSLARVTEGLETAVKWVSDFISKSPALQSALKGIAAAMAVILAITQPLWAAFVGLYLIIDDVVGYFQGKDSLLGAFLYYLDDLQNKINNSIDTPQWIKDLLALIGSVDKLDKLNETIANIKSGGNKKVNLFDAGGNILGGMNIKGQEHFARNLGLALGELIRQSITGNEADGTVTGEAAPVDYKVKVELPEWIKNMFTEVAAMSEGKGYVGTLPNLDNMFITPAMQRNISNSSTTTNTDNRQINMTNNIQTSQASTDLINQLAYARNAMTAGWA